MSRSCLPSYKIAQPNFVYGAGLKIAQNRNCDNQCGTEIRHMFIAQIFARN